MRRLLVTLALTLLTFGAARSAEATEFTLQSYTLDMQNGGTGGLNLWSKSLLPSPFTFDLNTVGQSLTADLFTIGTKQTSVDSSQEGYRDISVDFGFSAPLPGFGGTTQGITGAVQFLGGLGYVAWANPITLAFGNGGLLQISLSHALFGTPGSAVIAATFTLLSQDRGTSPIPTPEPATLLLMGAGLAGLVGRQWQRRRASLRR
jgi:PEP-CTERM motif